MFHDTFFLGGRHVITNNGEHIGEFRNLGIHRAVFDGVEEGMALFTPKEVLHFLQSSFGFHLVITVVIIVAETGADGHRTQCLYKQYLFEAEFPSFVHGEVHPVHKDPVVRQSFHQTVCVGTHDTVVH